MKIGIVCYPTYGGSGAIAAELGQVLSRRDHDVHVISYAPPFRLREFRANLHYHAVEVTSYPLFRYPPYDLALACKIMEVVSETGLDVVHVHYAIPHAISAHLAREMMPKSDIKIVTTLHGTDITLVGAERAYQEITRFGIEKSDRVTVVSRWLQEETARIFGTEREMAIIPNFVDSDRFRPLENPALRSQIAGGGEKILIHASNFRPVKRPLDVVRIFAKVREEIPAKLVLVGDGPELPRAVHLAAELKVREDVVIAGQQATVEGLLAIADLFLLPSEFESFGLAALEAMSCGVPVICTNAGGLPEVVTDGETGYLCEVGAVDCMADLARKLLGDSPRHRAMKEAARRAVLASYREEEIVDEYEAVYEDALGASSSDSSA